jgi:biotin synthase
MIWGIGVGYVISGNYFGWNLGLAEGGSVGLAIATAVVILMYITFTYSYAELACAIPQAGGVFDYTSRALGPNVGFIAGMAQNLEFILAPPAIALGIGSYMHLYLPAIPALYFSVGAYFLFTAVNTLGIKTAALVELMVNSGRGPTDGEIGQISEAVTELKERYPQLEVCVCAGLLKDGQADKLKACGVDAYNHNLNTSVNYYSDICSTHTYDDRVQTVEEAKGAGLSSCSGALFGMGEKDNHIVDLAFTFKKMGVDSIPVNFLIPIGGTPMESVNKLTPQKCLKILCLFRLVNPSSELRIAGGREVHLRWLQPFGLFVANSIFIGDYLTTKGQKPEADLAMIRDLGFELEGSAFDAAAVPAVAGPGEFAVRLK